MSLSNCSNLEDDDIVGVNSRTLKDILPKSNGVIFDLRSEYEFADEFKGYWSEYFSLFESLLSNQILSTPGYKSRFYDGFPPEGEGASYSGYSSGFYVKGAETIKPSSDNATNNVVFF